MFPIGWYTLQLLSYWLSYLYRGNSSSKNTQETSGGLRSKPVEKCLFVVFGWTGFKPTTLVSGWTLPLRAVVMEVSLMSPTVE